MFVSYWYRLTYKNQLSQCGNVGYLYIAVRLDHIELTNTNVDIYQKLRVWLGLLAVKTKKLINTDIAVF